jgi:probable selenate reductase FAD-binding subunit
MARIKAYHRPSKLAEALQLLSRPQVSTAIVAGGTYINAHLAETVDEVVDLQALNLAGVSYSQGRLALGAMVRLQTLVEDQQAPDLIRQAAHREGPNTLRNQATVGGLVAGSDPESELLAALLVSEAEVELQSGRGGRRMPLPDFLGNVTAALDGGLVTAISLAITGKGAMERVARTPADRPIVAAIARLDQNNQIHLALCGVAKTPILVEPILDQLKASLNPPNDFRGSSEYRRQIAVVLSKRVIASLQEKQ